MKKTRLLLLALTFVAMYSCKDSKKESKDSQDGVQAQSEESTEGMYSIVEDSTSVKFTAYKTTEKVPVGGQFNSIELKNAKSGEKPIDVLNGLEFSIPVSSLFTNDATGTRDPKIKEFFFGVMDQTELISGTFVFDDDKLCTVDLKLNGVSAILPLEYQAMDGHVTFTGVLDLKKWNALDALASLNKACEALHTGADGVSKTWEDVMINASVYIKKE